MNRRLDRNHRYRTDWIADGRNGKRIVVARVLRDHLVEAGQRQIHLDTMLEQAIFDDLKNNNGRMFGHDALTFFTCSMQYPESWRCIETVDGEALLERTPTHPHQSVVLYKYIPSVAFGGEADVPRFVVTNRGEI